MKLNRKPKIIIIKAKIPIDYSKIVIAKKVTLMLFM